MASALKYVRVPPNSASLAEARARVFQFFKAACRSIPSIMDTYNLDDVVSPAQLRSMVASEIRKNAHLTNPKIIDMLILKGTEELSSIVQHAKQRHHIIGQYVLGRHSGKQGLGTKAEAAGTSDFLQNFYRSNYF